MLPTGWHWARLGDICRVVGGSTPDSGNADLWNGDVVWVTPADLGKLVGKDICNSQRLITSAGLLSCSAEMVPPGTVMLSSRAPIGHVGVAKVPLCTNQGCKSLVPGPEIVSDYLYYAIKQAVPTLRRLGSGATFSEVSKSQVASFQVPLAPLPEQRRIAAILNEQMAQVERAKAAVQAQLEAARALPAAYLREVFENDEARAWPRRPLAGLCHIRARLVDPTSKTNRSLPHVNGECIESGTGRMLDVRTAAADKVTSSKYLFESGDVLYSKIRPNLKKVLLTSFAGLCSADVYPLTPYEGEVDARFLSFVLLSDEFTNYAVDESRRARMPKLNREQLMSWPSPCPPLSEQRRVAAILIARLAQVQQLRAMLDQQATEVDLAPQVLLHHAFSGGL